MTTPSSSGSQLGLIAEYVETLAKDPASRVFVPLSEIYRKMGLLDDAYQVASSGVRHLPGYAAGHVALARVQSQCGDLTAAAGSFSKALDLDADSLPALKGLAKVKRQVGDVAEARRLLERAATVAPNDETLRSLLAALPLEKKAPETADATVSAARTPRRAHRPPADPFTTVTIAEIYIRQGFLRRALKIYRDLLATDPSDEDIRQRLIALKNQIAEQEMQEAGAEGGESEGLVESGVVEQTPRDTGLSSVGLGGEAVPDALVETAPAVSEDVATEVVAENVSSPQDGTGATLAVLTRWLAAIRQRRAHVS